MAGRVGIVRVSTMCLAMCAVVPVTAQRVGAEQGLPASIVSAYSPPACVPGVPFSDVTCTTGFDPWIEQLGLDGITAGCGGGNYCPGAPVTRDQMAVFIEKAMRGTANWPAHTVLVWAIKNTDGSPNPTASGQGLLTGVGGIPSSGNDAPSAANPWLVKVGPGVYDIGANSVQLPVYTALEGSGQDITVITAAGYPEGVQGTVTVADHSELRFLTVSNTGGSNQYAIAVYCPWAPTVRMEHVAINATQPPGGIRDALGIEGGRTVLMSHVSVSVSSSATSRGVTAWSGDLDHVSVTVVNSGGSTSALTAGLQGLPGIVLSDSAFAAQGGAENTAVWLQGTSDPAVIRSCRIEAWTPGALRAALYVLDSSALLEGTDIHAYGGGAAIKTWAGSAGPATEIANSRIWGTVWLSNGQFYQTNVATSKLQGATENSGGLACAGNYTGNFTFLGNTCP